MARFPHAPVDLVSEMFIDGQYRSVRPDMRARQLVITGGRANEQAQLGPTTSSFVIGDPDRVYAPRNPLSPYFGKLGRNTPVRQAIRDDYDTFTRTVSNGWGTSTAGTAWLVEGTATPYSVAGGVGSQSVAAANSFLASYLGGVALRTVRTAVTWNPNGLTTITGADIEPATLTVRRLSSTDYYYARVSVTTAGAVRLSLKHADETSIWASQTILSGWAGERLRVACLIEGHALFAKVWRVDTEAEPYGWHVQGMIKTSTLPAAGSVGIRSGIAFGNTNTKPIRFDYSDWEMTVPVAFTEVTRWPTKQDRSGQDRTVPIEAKGITRRLGQGKAILRSTLHRGILAEGTAVAYWPCEDGRDSTSIASGLADGLPMRVLGAPRYATYSDIPATGPIPELALSQWFGDVVPYTGTGEIYVSMLLHVPDGGTVDQDPIFQVRTSGAATYWNLRYGAGGTLQLEAYNINIVNLLNTGPIGFNVNGKRIRLALSLSENGSGGVDWQIATLEVGATVGGTASGTVASTSVNAATALLTNTLGHMDQVAMGQIAIYPAIQSLFALYQELNAYTGESAGTRAQRLCGENSIVFVPVGDPDLTTPMGPQRPDTLLNLLKEAEDADGGFLFEPLGVLGLGYRTRTSMYNQQATLATTHGALSNAQEWEPLDDDQLTRNDITVTRKDGSSVRVVKTMGPLSVLPSDQGGVGVYDTSATVNVETDAELDNVAGWLLHLGTVDEARYPSMLVDLASATFAASASLYRQALSLFQGDRLVISNPPPGQAPDDISQLVTGITRRIGTWSYRIEVNCVPESPWQVFILDSSRLAPTASELTDNETSSDTSVRLSTTGTVWTTDPAQMPIPLKAGGEAMNFTAISGASSPQTGTAVRAVNNVHKEQTAGTSVELRNPPILAW